MQDLLFYYEYDDGLITTSNIDNSNEGQISDYKKRIDNIYGYAPTPTSIIYLGDIK